MRLGIGILANRIQVLLSTMQQQTKTVKLIVTARKILHNLMLGVSE